MSMPVIAVENHSTVVSDAEVDAWAAACGRQVGGRSRMARFWGQRAQVMRVPKGGAKEPWWQALILDDSDMEGALGYHDVSSPWNGPRLKVFAATDQKYGLNGSVTLSHEIVEEICDPWCMLGWQTDDNTFYAVEVADPVEADTLGYELAGQGSFLKVTVSDYALPAWFIPGAPPPYTCVHSIILDTKSGRKPPVSAPLEIAAGGYMSIYVAGKGWGQIDAEGKFSKVDDPAEKHSVRDRLGRRQSR